MNQQEKHMVDLLKSNYDAIDKAFKLEGNDSIANAALAWTLADRQTTTEQIRTSFEYLKTKASALSVERSTGKLTLVARMALSGDDAGYLAEVQRIFANIMEGKKLETSSRFGTAMLIANCAKSPEDADRLTRRTKAIFAAMREKHPVITDDRDMTFSAIVALADRDDEALLADAEECYQLLGAGYKLSDGRQTMAHVLALSSMAPAEKVERVHELRAAFKARKLSIGWTSSHEYAVLALLAADERSVDEIADDVAEVVDYIKKQKGFGGLSLTGGIRLLYAATISTVAHQGKESVSAVSDAIALAVAQAIVDWIIIIAVIY